MRSFECAHVFCPARCPGCGDVVHLIVGSRGTLTAQVHNKTNCDRLFQYRCFIEEGAVLPTIEFVTPDQPSTGADFSAAAYYRRPAWCFPHKTARSRAR